MTQSSGRVVSFARFRNKLWSDRVFRESTVHESMKSVVEHLHGETGKGGSHTLLIRRSPHKP